MEMKSKLELIVDFLPVYTFVTDSLWNSKESLCVVPDLFYFYKQQFSSSFPPRINNRENPPPFSLKPTKIQKGNVTRNVSNIFKKKSNKMERKKLTYFPISLLLMYLLYCVIDAPEEIVFFFLRRLLRSSSSFFTIMKRMMRQTFVNFYPSFFFVNPWLELLMRCPIR